MPDQLQLLALGASSVTTSSDNRRGEPSPTQAKRNESEALSGPPPTSSLLLPYVDPPLLSCTLQKRSPATPAMWQVRHFILYPDLLLYSTTCSPSSLSSPLGLIPLSSIIYVTGLPSSPLRFDFIVQADKSTHTFQLLTTSSELTEQWVRRLKRLTQAGNAGRVAEADSGWYERKGKFWKNAEDIAMRRRVRRAHMEYERDHPLTGNGPSPTAPLLSGFIRKRSPALLQLWQSRYFVLYPAVIVYSRTMGSDMLGALAVLSIVWMDKREECRLDISVEAEDGTGLGKERVMQLQLDSEDERDVWHSRIASQLAVIKHDRSASNSHSRNDSAELSVPANASGSRLELTRADEAKPDSLLFSQQRKAHTHTPYMGARSGSSTTVPALPSQPYKLSPPLPPVDYSHGLSPPSFLGRKPASPLSVVKQSKRLALQTKSDSHSPHQHHAHDVNTAMPLTAALSSITAPSRFDSTSTQSAASHSSSPFTSPPTAADLVVDALPASASVLTRSSSCYTDRATSAARPLIQRSADDSELSVTRLDACEADVSPPPPNHRSDTLQCPQPELGRSRSASVSHSALSPPPPFGGLLDEGIILTLFRYTPDSHTLSLGDIVLAYCPRSHTLTCRPAEAGLAAGGEQQPERAQEVLEFSVDELESVSIGRQSSTMQRLSPHIGADCCLTVTSVHGSDINVVAKGPALIKLLHKELCLLSGGGAVADEQPLEHDKYDEADFADELHSHVKQDTQDRLDELAAHAELPVQVQLSVAPHLTTPSLAPYINASNLIPILSTSPNLSRSRSAPVGATLRFQDRIEVHEYVQPASYTPSQEESGEQADDDDDLTGGLTRTYSHDDDGGTNDSYAALEQAYAALEVAHELELPTASDEEAAAAIDAEVGRVEPADAVCEVVSECAVASEVDVPVAPPLQASGHEDPSPSVQSFAASEQHAAVSETTTHVLPSAASTESGEAKRSMFGAPFHTAAASLAALMQGLAKQNQPVLHPSSASTHSIAFLEADATALSDTASGATSPSSVSSAASHSSDHTATTHAFGVRLRSVSSRTSQPTCSGASSDASLSEARALSAPELVDSRATHTSASAPAPSLIDTTAAVSCAHGAAVSSLPCPPSPLDSLHRAASSPAAPSSSSLSSAQPVPSRRPPLAPASSHLASRVPTEGDSALLLLSGSSSSSSVSVSALKNLWQHKSEDGSPTSRQQSTAFRQ